MLRLRPYKTCDAPQIVSWFEGEKTFRFWATDKYDHYPITPDELNQYYEAYEDQDDFYAMTAFDDEDIVGHMVLRFLDEAKTEIRFCFIVVDHSKRGKGYGKEMLNLALTYAFDILKAKKVSVCVFEHNSTAYECYKKLGFTDVLSKEPDIFHIMGEDWIYKELAMIKEGK